MERRTTTTADDDDGWLLIDDVSKRRRLNWFIYGITAQQENMLRFLFEWMVEQEERDEVEREASVEH